MFNDIDDKSQQQNKTKDIRPVLSLEALITMTVLGFNDTSTLVGHFVSSPRERENRDRRDSRRDERDG